jgi:ribose-phosphate pyrophosphokinase
MLLFALKETTDYAKLVAQHLGIPISQVKDQRFQDGEFKVSLKELVKDPVKDQQVCLLQSLYQEREYSLDAKICRLLFLSATLKRAGARKLTTVIPYFAYARQDRQDEPGDPLTHQLLATLLETGGTDTLITLDVHNPSAFQNAFRCTTLNLEATDLFVDHLGHRLRSEKIAVVSPDAGGIKRAQNFARKLESRLNQSISLAILVKSRQDHEIVMHQLLGDVNKKTVIIYDDLISTGATLFRAAKACKSLGARRVVAVATHGLFCGGANELLSRSDEVDHFVITDSILNRELLSDSLKERITVLSTAKLVADAIGKFK